MVVHGIVYISTRHCVNNINTKYMIDLNALHSMLGMAGYYWFTGNTNNAGDMQIEFYSGSNFKGNHFWITLSGENSYDIDFQNERGRFDHEGITENKVFSIIKEEL